MHPAGDERFLNMDFLPMGIMVLDRELRVVFWNACLESWTGHARAKVLNRDVRRLFPLMNRPFVLPRLQALFEGAPPAVFSYHLHKHLVPSRLPDGSFRLQHSVAYGLRGPDGEIGHVVLSLQDVTEIHNRLDENLRIRRELERENRIRRKVEIKFRELATRDMLTGLANRRWFLGVLAREVRRAKRFGHPLCLLVIDLDHFKLVNDTWGHLAGDEMLRQFAASCREKVREIDQIGRLGGEEFGVVMPETTLEGARAVAGRLLQAVRALSVSHEGVEVRVTASIGLACLCEGQDLREFLHAADQAMYQAKLNGRDRLELAQD